MADVSNLGNLLDSNAWCKYYRYNLLRRSKAGFPRGNIVTEMVTVSGQIIFDDLLPIELCLPGWDDLIDGKREFAYRNPRMIGTEVRTTASQVAIIVTRFS